LSRHLLFAAVDLGARHAERLRTMLDTEDPGDAADYPCFLSVLYVAGEQRADVMLQADAHVPGLRAAAGDDGLAVHQLDDCADDAGRCRPPCSGTDGFGAADKIARADNRKEWHMRK